MRDLFFVLTGAGSIVFGLWLSGVDLSRDCPISTSPVPPPRPEGRP